MEYILIICISLITLAVLKFVWGIRIKDIKLLKELGFDKKLNEITNKYPDDKFVIMTSITHNGYYIITYLFISFIKTMIDTNSYRLLILRLSLVKIVLSNAKSASE